MRTRTIIATGITATLTAGILVGGATGFTTGRLTAPTPEACLVALDEGERALGLTADALDLSADAVIAAATWDTTTLEQITLDIEGITADMGDGAQYRTAATECRGGAR